MVSQSSYGFKKLEKPHIFKKLDETIWFPKIWFLNQKMVSQNMVLISWFPSRGSQSFYGTHLVVSITFIKI